MAKAFAKQFYRSKAWQECRAAYIQSVHGLCERCQKKGKVVPGYIVHHKEELTPENINDPNVTLNWEKLEYVCLECHNEEHGVGKSSPAIRDGLMFDENGDVVPA